MHAIQSNRGLHIIFGNFEVMTMIIVSVVATTASGVLVSASLAVLTLFWMMLCNKYSFDRHAEEI